jgi:hypothetical protein
MSTNKKAAPKRAAAKKPAAKAPNKPAAKEQAAADPKAARASAAKASKASPLRTYDPAEESRVRAEREEKEAADLRKKQELRRRGIKMEEPEVDDSIETTADSVEAAMKTANSDLGKTKDPIIANALRSFIAGGSAVISAINAKLEKDAQEADAKAEEAEYEAELAKAGKEEDE